jgi:hypothetical protein
MKMPRVAGYAKDYPYMQETPLEKFKERWNCLALGQFTALLLHCIVSA